MSEVHDSFCDIRRQIGLAGQFCKNTAPTYLLGQLAKDEPWIPAGGFKEFMYY